MPYSWTVSAAMIEFATNQRVRMYFSALLMEAYGRKQVYKYTR
jgi:hypothetical protein